MTDEVPWLIKVDLIVKSSINAAVACTAGVDIAMISATGSCWMDLIIDFLAEDRVLDDEKEANRIRGVAPRY